MTKSVAIVSGASSGIGRATAIRLARDFDGVVLVARNREKLEEVAGIVRATADAMIVEADLSDADAPQTVVGAAVARLGRIDAVVNIAGAVPGVDLFEMSDAQWDAGLALKFHGARRLTLAAWDALKASQGSAIFMSGAAAETPKAAQAAVGVINAAITALAKTFADRGIRDGVQVNSVLPGAVMTVRRRGMIKSFASAHGLSVEEASRQMLERTGIRRYGEPGEIADLIAYLVAPRTRWLTGSQVRIDGGETAAV